MRKTIQVQILQLIQPPIQRVSGDLPQESKQQGHKTSTHLDLLLRFRVDRAVDLLPLCTPSWHAPALCHFSMLQVSSCGSFGKWSGTEAGLFLALSLSLSPASHHSAKGACTHLLGQAERNSPLQATVSPHCYWIRKPRSNSIRSETSTSALLQI